jgi:beta-N-acetylhexosaminidase
VRRLSALRRVGVNVVLGPVADVAGGTAGSVMASRAYPGDAAAVAASTRAAVRAYLRAGVLPVVKHFPGLGRARDEHRRRSRSTVGRTRPDLAADLAPFRMPHSTRARRSRCSATRATRRSTPNGSPRSPTRSRPSCCAGTLRFDGVTMTDSLEAEAALAPTGGDVGTAAVRALMRRRRPAAADRARARSRARATR